MNLENLPYWLALARLQTTPIKIRRYSNLFPDIKKLFFASVEELQAATLSAKAIDALKNPDWKSVESDLAWSKKSDCHIVTIADDQYPVLLRELPDAPVVLFVKGNLESLMTPQIAIVGTRNPTVSGKETAYQFAYSLAQSGLTITSGLALGIDAASHQGALAASAQTIAVAGTGLNQTYPAIHKKLAEKILAEGALISEFPPDIPPMAKNFPKRNRVISGLSLGVLVVEAAIQSGSLITARFAAEQGREVFAVPGSIHNPLARGCHHIIQQGAKLIETVEDILEELGALSHVATEVKMRNKLPKLDAKHQHLLGQIGYEITALDMIIQRSGLTAAEVSSMLLALELRGSVHTVCGGYALTARSES